MFPTGTNVRKKTGLILLLALILTGNAFFLRFNAFRHFNLLDMGSFLDASWRIYRGQRPYMDFVYYTGPVYLYLNAFFFHLLGFGKAAILSHLVVVHSAVILLVFFMLYKRVPFPVTLSATALTVPSFYWAISHPWHDQTAHLWGIIGLSLLVRNLPFQEPSRALLSFSQLTTNKNALAWGKKSSIRISLLCGFFSVLSLMTKSNIGLAYGLMFFTVLAASDNRGKALPGFCAGLLIGGIVALGLVRFPHEYLDQCLAFSRHDGIKRISKLSIPGNWLVNFYWVAPAIMLPSFIFVKKKSPDAAALFLGITFVGIFTVNTGGMVPLGNNMLWGVHLALAFIALYSLSWETAPRWSQPLRKISAGLLLALTIFLTVLSVRYGLQLKVWTYFTPNPQGDYALQSEPLRGWRFHRFQGEPLDILVNYIKTHVPKNDSLLNLNDLYIIYALTGRDSYPGIPFIFIGDIFPAPGKQTEKMRRVIIGNPPDWVVLDIKTSYGHELAWLGLQEEFKRSYAPVIRAGSFLLLKRK